METHGDARHRPRDEEWLDRLREVAAPLTVAQFLLRSSASTVAAAAARPIGGGVGPPPPPWYTELPPQEKEELRRLTRQLDDSIRVSQAAIAEIAQGLAALGARES